MFEYNVRFDCEDKQGSFSQTFKVVTSSQERAVALARQELAKQGSVSIRAQRIHLVGTSVRVEELRARGRVNMPDGAPAEVLDEQKLRRTLWPIVECMVKQDFERLEQLCEIAGGVSAEEACREVKTYPARFVLPPDDELATLVDDEAHPFRHPWPQERLVWGKLYSEEEGRSDLTYWLCVWDEGRERYEARLDGVLVP